MNRRNFLRFLSTGTAIAAVAPSQVWPFRKIFLPTNAEVFGYGVVSDNISLQVAVDNMYFFYGEAILSRHPVKLSRIDVLEPWKWVDVRSQMQEQKKVVDTYPVDT